MSVVVYVNNEACDLAIAAFQLIAHVEAAGHHAQIFCDPAFNPTRMDQLWPGFANKRTIAINSGTTIVSLTAPSPTAFARWSKARTVLLGTCLEPHERLAKSANLFHAVLAPSKPALKILERYTSRVIACGWHVPQMATISRAPGDPPKLYVPAYTGLSVRIAGLARIVAASLVGTDATALVELADRPECSRRGMRAAFKRMGLESRVTVVAPMAYAARLGAMAASDLTLDLVPGQPLAMAARMSLAAGTPVIGFATAALSEIVMTPHQGILVPFRVGAASTTRLRDCAHLASAASQTLNSPAVLAQMRQAAGLGALKRAAVFTAALKLALAI